MNIILSDLCNYISKSLSVGNAIQNILFYSLISFLIMINIYLARQKKVRTREQVVDDNKTSTVGLPSFVSVADHERIIQENATLKHDISSLKNELLAIGEELEFSYIKSDRLNDQLNDILDSLELTVAYDDHLWNWSIDFKSDQITFSDYGLEVRGLSKGRKLTWMEALDLVDEQDRKKVETALLLSMKTGADFSMKYMIKPANGSAARWIKSFGHVVYSDHYIPLRLTGKFSFTHAEPIATDN